MEWTMIADATWCMFMGDEAMLAVARLKNGEWASINKDGDCEGLHDTLDEAKRFCETLMRGRLH